MDLQSEFATIRKARLPIFFFLCTNDDLNSVYQLPANKKIHFYEQEKMAINDAINKRI